MLRARVISYLPLSNANYPGFQLPFVHWRGCWQDFSSGRRIVRGISCICDLKSGVNFGLISRRVVKTCFEGRALPDVLFTRKMICPAGGQYESLKGKVVLITGACSGIGAGTARVFAKNGSCLGLCGESEKDLKKTADECIELGLSSEQIKSHTGDLTSLDCCKETIKHVVDHFGKLDVLVNCAGRLPSNTVENITPKGYDDLMNLNVRAVVFLTQYALPHLIKTKGSVVNVSSVVGLRSFPGILAYCMSKAAISHFTRCCALELALRGVRVNAVNPGMIKTQVHKRGGMSKVDYAKFLKRSKKTHALGRVGEPEEVGNVIAFLASDAASFITGENVPVDGGKQAMCPR